MAIKQIVTWELDGTMTVEEVEVFEIDTQIQIEQKEQELIRIYNEIQELKSRNNE